MALAATPGIQKGYIILSFDGANAFSTIFRHQMPPALTEVIPVATHYATEAYARKPPKLTFTTDGRANEVMPSARGVQQDCNFRPQCYSKDSLRILRDFLTGPPVPGARVRASIDGITAILPPESARDILERQPERLLMKELKFTLKKIAEIDTERRVKDAVGASRAAVVAEKWKGKGRAARC